MAPRRAGFTFVEILMVMMVVAILFAIAFPRLTTMRARANVGSAMQRVAATITTARQMAISRGVPVKVAVQGNTVFSVASPYGAADSIQRKVSLQTLYGTALDGDAFELLFDPRGLASGIDATKKVVVTYADKSDTLCVQKLGNVKMRDC